MNLNGADQGGMRIVTVEREDDTEVEVEVQTTPVDLIAIIIGREVETRMVVKVDHDGNAAEVAMALGMTGDTGRGGNGVERGIIRDQEGSGGGITVQRKGGGRKDELTVPNTRSLYCLPRT